MSDVIGAFEVHFSSFHPQFKALDMDATPSGAGAGDSDAGWPSPTSIAGVNASAPMGSADLAPSSLSVSSSSTSGSNMPVSQVAYYDSTAPAWAYPPQTSAFMPNESVEPLPIHPHPHHMDSARRASFGVAVDEQLEADARMLQEVLQEAVVAPADAGGLQLLFVPPVELSREQQQHPLIPPTQTFPAVAQPFPTFPLSVASLAAAKKDDDFAARPLSSSLAMTPPVSHSSALKTADAALALGAQIKTEARSSLGLISPSPSVQHQVFAPASRAPSMSPTVSYATGVPTLTMTSEASALPKKKRSGTTRICKVEGCTKGIRSRGLCKAHGGGRRCTTPGCTTSDQGGGHCVLHGGGRRCSVEGCTKSAQWRGVCKMHGGARRCRYGNCTKNGQVKQGYCRMHHNLVTLQRQQQQQQQQQQVTDPGSLPPVL